MPKAHSSSGSDSQEEVGLQSVDQPSRPPDEERKGEKGKSFQVQNYPDQIAYLEG